MEFDDILDDLQPLDRAELTMWIERRWVLPSRRDGVYRFSAADVARVRLVHDIRYALDIDIETVPVLLSLLDRYYGARRQLRTVLKAIDAEPGDVRARIMAHVESATEGADPDQ